MSFELKGRIVEIFNTQTITDKFKKREFIVEYADNPSGTYVQYLKFQFTGDKVSVLDTYKAGQEVNISFNLKGRKYEKDGRVSYFMDLEAWKLSTLDNMPESNNNLPSYESYNKLEEEDENGGLPF
jgi:single-strand DNA-binding protein